MKEYTDYVEYPRPNGKMVRIVYEIYGAEILFHYYEYQHDKNSEWKSMTKGENGVFEYSVIDENGEEKKESIAFITDGEMTVANQTMLNRYVDFSV